MTRYAAKTVQSPVSAAIEIVSDNEDIHPPMELDNSNPPVCQSLVDEDAQIIYDSASDSEPDIDELYITEEDCNSGSEYDSDELNQLFEDSKRHK